MHIVIVVHETTAKRCNESWAGLLQVIGLANRDADTIYEQTLLPELIETDAIFVLLSAMNTVVAVRTKGEQTQRKIYYRRHQDKKK